MYPTEIERNNIPIELQRAGSLHLGEDLLVQARARGISLTELLEELDPSGCDSPLDAFERQLAVAGIRVSGSHADTIDRFFASTESAVLFPEYVSRSIRTGMSDYRGLGQIVASRTRIDSDVYKTLYMDESVNTAADKRLARVGEGGELPRLSLRTSEHSIRIRKFGRYLEVTYEALRRKSTSVVSVFLRAIGYQVQKDKFEEALQVLINGDGNENAAATQQVETSGTLTYEDLVGFALSFQPYEMNVMIANPAVVKAILTLDEFKDPQAGMNFQGTGDLVTPFGARLIVSDAVPDQKIIGLDRRYALEEVYETGLLVESDRLIRQQIEGTAVSEVCGFAKVITDASQILELTTG